MDKALPSHFYEFDGMKKVVSAYDRFILYQFIELFKFLDGYVVTHFKDEDDLMAANYDPFIESQREQHRKFVSLFLSS